MDKEVLNLCGIYRIINLVNNKAYIGSARKFKTRFRKHKNALIGGNHHSLKLQRAWNKYGEDNFLFEPILICEPKDLLFYEQCLLDFYDSYHGGYNARIKVNSNLGMKMTDSAKAKISEARKGTNLSEETKRKISQGSKGKIVSQLTKDKISLSHKGKKKSKSHIENIRKSNLGKLLSDLTKEKISLSLIGNDRAKGYKFSDEQKDRISKAHLGIKQNKEWVELRIAKRLETLRLNKLNNMEI